MTEPIRPPAPWSAEAYAYANRPIFCVECETHATAAKPLCPVCLDDDVKRLEAS